jgi:nucleoside diphosphate kinase
MARFETERTYVMIKPDGVQRGLVGNVISRFEAKGFVLKGLKLFQCPQALAEEHYKVRTYATLQGARHAGSRAACCARLTRFHLHNTGPERQAVLQGPGDVHLLRPGGRHGARQSRQSRQPPPQACLIHPD